MPRGEGGRGGEGDDGRVKDGGDNDGAEDAIFYSDDLRLSSLDEEGRRKACEREWMEEEDEKRNCDAP